MIRRSPVSGIVKIRNTAIIILAAAGLLVFVFYDPVKTIFFPKCPFHLLTGLHCPGCGAQRALHQLLRGHIAAALDYNPLFVLALPFLGYAVISELLRMARGHGLPRVVKSPAAGWAVLAVIIVFWILRNIPFAPFTYLAP